MNSIEISQHTIRVTDKVYPNFSIVHNNLGTALFAIQRNEDAIYNFRIAIKLKSTNTNAHYSLGVILLQKGELKEAVHHLRETLRLRPSFIEAQDYLELAILKSRGIE